MKKRNSNKQTSAQFISIEDKEDQSEVNFSELQMKKLPNQFQRQSVLPNFTSLLQASSIISDAKNEDDNFEKNNENSYSYSYSYSNSENENDNNDNNNSNGVNNDEEITKESPEMQEMNDVFHQLFEKFGSYDDQGDNKIKKKIQETKEARDKIQSEIDEIDSTIGSNVSNTIWIQKQFFTELIDFIDTASSTDFKDFSEVKPEYLNIDYSIEKIKNFQKLDPNLYKSCGFPSAVQELFEFYAIIETNDFCLTDKKPFIDLQWIRTGWRWTDEFGNPDLVPKVFEGTCLPILINKLKSEEIPREEDYRTVFLHCVEMIDYCLHPSMAESQIFSALKKRLESAFGTGRIKYEAYNKMMIEFGFKQAKLWEGGDAF